MAVPEPTSSLGLWPAVKARTEWPDTDEEAMNNLAQSWKQAGIDFGYAGHGSAGQLVEAWPDEAGLRFQVAVAKLDEAAARSGEAMSAFAAQAETFAGDVEHAKKEIVNAIEINLEAYQEALLVPGGASEAIRENFVATLAKSINDFLDAMAARIEARGAGGQVSPDLPDLNTDEVAQADNGFSIADAAGVVSSIASVAALFPPFTAVAAPIALVSGAVALAGHVDDVIDSNGGVAEWSTVAGDVAALLPGAGAARLGWKLADEALLATRVDEAVKGLNAAAQSSSKFQAGLNAVLAQPTVAEWAETGEQYADPKEAASVGYGATNAAQVMRLLRP